jgi:hypothetical protein
MCCCVRRASHRDRGEVSDHLLYFLQDCGNLGSVGHSASPTSRSTGLPAPQCLVATPLRQASALTDGSWRAVAIMNEPPALRTTAPVKESAANAASQS